MVLNKKVNKRIRKSSEETLTGKNKRFDLMSTDLSGAMLDVPTKNIVNKTASPKKGNPFLKGFRG